MGCRLHRDQEGLRAGLRAGGREEEEAAAHRANPWPKGGTSPAVTRPEPCAWYRSLLPEPLGLFSEDGGGVSRSHSRPCDSPPGAGQDEGTVGDPVPTAGLLPCPARVASVTATPVSAEWCVPSPGERPPNNYLRKRTVNGTKG